MSLLALFFIATSIYPIFLVNEKFEVTNYYGAQYPTVNRFYAGHIEIPKKQKKTIFYEFVTANTTSYPDPTHAPFIIWIEGGPGCSGVFVKHNGIGPFIVQNVSGNPKLLPNNNPWTEFFNILFIDAPLGTGFSQRPDDLAHTTEEAVDEILTVFLSFSTYFPEFFEDFKRQKLHVMAHGYGAHFAPLFVKRIKNEYGTKFNMQGLMLFSPWVNPMIQVTKFSDLLYSAGMISSCGHNELNRIENEIVQNILEGELERAHYLFQHHLIEKYIDMTGGASVYNLRNYDDWDPDSSLLPPGLWLNSTETKTAFKASHIDSYTYCNRELDEAFKVDSMLSVMDDLNYLLDKKGMAVLVINAQDDYITNSAGTMMWLTKLKYDKLPDWLNSQRGLLKFNDEVVGYYKQYERLHHALINKAGHFAYIEQPEVTRDIVKKFIQWFT